jgi:ABC-2 type transport system permease protein
MKTTLLLAKKDFKQLVNSPLFYFIGALCAVIWFIAYMGFIRQFSNQSMMAGVQGGEGPNIIRGVFTPHISVTNLIFIVAIPLLTMWLIAEEKQKRSYDLLLTSPITATQIVIGKYLAGVGAAVVLLLLSLAYPVGTALIAKFNWSLLFSIYMGLFFISALYVAAGLFASSLTDSPMLAAFMAVIFNFLIWFVGPSAAGTDIKWLSAVMDQITVGQHLMNFVNGAVQINSIVFFITAIGFFLFLSQRVVESSRWR